MRLLLFAKSEIITDSKYIYLIINMLTCWKEDWGIDSAKRAVYITCNNSGNNVEAEVHQAM